VVIKGNENVLSLTYKNYKLNPSRLSFQMYKVGLRFRTITIQLQVFFHRRCDLPFGQQDQNYSVIVSGKILLWIILSPYCRFQHKTISVGWEDGVVLEVFSGVYSWLQLFSFRFVSHRRGEVPLGKTRAKASGKMWFWMTSFMKLNDAKSILGVFLICIFAALGAFILRI